MNLSGDRFRYAVDFAIDGDIRFLAHNDMVRQLSRACARAGLPVSFTGGFNPRMRLSLPFPRPVGQGSDVERLLVDLTQALSEEELIGRLEPQMPGGIVLKGASRLHPSDTCQPVWVQYHVVIAPEDHEAAASRAKSLLDSESIEVTRVRHKDGRSKLVDIRPFLDSIDVSPRGVDLAMYVTSSGSATPNEVCEVLGMEAGGINHLVRRTRIRWQESQPKQAVKP